MLLSDLNQNVSILKGIGKKSVAQLRGIGITTVSDILQHYPRAYEDRKKKVPLGKSTEGRPVNTVATIIAHNYFGRLNNKTLKVQIEDDTATASLVCFGRNFLARSLHVGMQIRVYGSFQYSFGELQSSRFEFEAVGAETNSQFDKLLPVYPLTADLTQSFFRKTILQAVSRFAGTLSSELPDSMIDTYGLLSKSDAIRTIHQPQSVEASVKARETLVREELFHLQLKVLAKKPGSRQRRESRPPLDTSLQRDVINNLPFELTADQKKVIGEINVDLASQAIMARLLQGDVGSGKTLVALLSAAAVIKTGGQVAIMAPTELLAAQHATNAAALFEQYSINVAFISGTVTGAARDILLSKIASGDVQLLIGTHAMFTGDVILSNLQYIIIDEQHKFGVLQRSQLIRKGRDPDVLLMTATPIPRTLTMTVFGDLSVSSIHTMPAGRIPVRTHLVKEGNETKAYEFVRKELAAGKQAYFIYPLIEQSDKIELKDTISAYEELRKNIFPEFTCALLNSRVEEEQKEAVMSNFSEGRIDVLVATSVVEVGVDVPNATCLVIHHAERFGLSSLHQIRGRVGRSNLQSYAFLIYSTSITETGKQRLMVMKNSGDGFHIAEEDLKIRGPGDLTGVKQAGFMRLKIADLVSDLDILKQAREDLMQILKKDPALSKPEHRILKTISERSGDSNDKIMEGSTI